MMDAALPAGVVFDCDGTIVDTEPVARSVLREVLASFDYEPTDEDFVAITGSPGHVTYRHFAARVALPPEQEFRRAIRSRWRDLGGSGFAVFPDAVETITQLAAAGVSIAITSSSSRGHVERAVEAAAIGEMVAVMLSADDVVRHKPDPEPYLAAARGLGLDASACTAVEDSPTGVASALAAGMFTVAVARESAAGLDDAHRVVHSITLDACVPPRER